ncbi:CIA30 family protein [Flavobacteriaceae bacterium M23B6Z8]
MMNQSLTVFDFTKDADISSWQVVDDVVMGGRSDGNFYLNSEGHAIFEGNVSLENNGGFSSVRHRTNKTMDVSPYQKVVLKLKGDGNRYQFRIKSQAEDYYSYIAYFETTGDWQTVEINMNTMYPTFRGRKLDMPNYEGKQLEELAFLIGNKKPQNFKLLIDKIVLE